MAVQCFALRLLADFTLMYQNCVGVLLKRDTDLATKEVGLEGRHNSVFWKNIELTQE